MTKQRFDGLQIVWLQSPPWDGLWTRQNHFALRLARDGARVLYVENPVAFAARVKAGSLRSDSRQVQPNITVLSPPLQVPGSRHSEWVASINGRRIADAVRQALDRMAWSRYLTWCRLPSSLPALERLSPAGVVYDVTDDYEFYAKDHRERELTVLREKGLARRASQIFTTTDELCKKLRLLTSAPVETISNGVDESFFSNAESETGLQGIPRPRIGFVGLVAEWMDFELLSKLGHKWPGQVVVVGPIKDEVRRKAEGITGLVLMHAVRHSEVAGIIRSFDVCIMPHLATELRHRSDPLKIIEYLSTGKPIVSIALRNIESLRGLVDLARTHEEFISLVANRIANPVDGLAEQRRSAARARSWDVLYGRVADCVERVWNGR